MTPFVVRNPTEAAPRLLQLMVTQGRAKDDRLILPSNITVLFSAPFEPAMRWLAWPDSPLETFVAAVENNGHAAADLRPAERGADRGAPPLTLKIQGTDTDIDLEAFLGRAFVQASIWAELSVAWRGTPVSSICLSSNGLSCRKALVDQAGELLLEVDAEESYPRRVSIDQSAVEDLAVFARDGIRSMGYRSRFVRRVVVPMAAARDAVRGKDIGAAIDILGQNDSDWTTISKEWLSCRRKTN